jgi:hypothetical protein
MNKPSSQPKWSNNNNMWQSLTNIRGRNADFGQYLGIDQQNITHGQEGSRAAADLLPNGGPPLRDTKEPIQKVLHDILLE